jgi:glycerol-3-phosphate dehydrogenase
MVVLNALDAAEHGAVIRTRTRCTRVERRDGGNSFSTIAAGVK